MSRYIFWYVSLSFAIGISFGYFYQTGAISKLSIKEPTKLVLLVPESLIPEDLFESYKFEHDVEIVIDYYASDEDFAQKSQDFKQYDLILAPHTRIPDLKALGIIRPIDVRHLENIVNVSADFRDLPTDPGGRYSIPLVWGISASRKVSSTDDYASPYLKAGTLAKGLLFQNMHSNSKPTNNFLESKHQERQTPALWIQSFVLPINERKSDCAYKLVDFFLTSEIAIELAKITNKSSTNITVEPTRLDAKLKPSHIRTQKFAQITRARQ